MMHIFRQAWSDILMPILQRSKRLQVAALCYRETQAGRQVLLITSRDSGRWIVPKGWPMEGLEDHEAALQEAWEEAGVRRANINARPVGSYGYDKGLSDGDSVAVEVQVYPALVQDLQDDFPEVDQRRRDWFAPEVAADLVDEPELKAILRAF